MKLTDKIGVYCDNRLAELDASPMQVCPYVSW